MKARSILRSAAILIIVAINVLGQENKPEMLYKKAVPSVMTLKAEFNSAVAAIECGG